MGRPVECGPLFCIGCELPPCVASGWLLVLRAGGCLCCERVVACDAGGPRLASRASYPRACDYLRRGRGCLFRARAPSYAARAALCVALRSSFCSVRPIFFCERLRAFNTRREARTCGVGVCLTRPGMFSRFPVWNVSDAGLSAWDFLGAGAFEPSSSPYSRDERRACVHGGAHALRFIRREEYEHV